MMRSALASVVVATVIAVAVVHAAAAQSALDAKPGTGGYSHSPIVTPWPGPFVPIAHGTPQFYYAPSTVHRITFDPKGFSVDITNMDVQNGQVLVANTEIDCATLGTRVVSISVYDANTKEAIERLIPDGGPRQMQPAEPGTQRRALTDQLCAAH